MEAGFYILSIPWRKPERVELKKLGNSLFFSINDSYGRRCTFDGEDVGYGITVFWDRYGGFERFVVKGNWLETTYRDCSGANHKVTITHVEEEAENH